MEIWSKGNVKELKPIKNQTDKPTIRYFITDALYEISKLGKLVLPVK